MSQDSRFNCGRFVESSLDMGALRAAGLCTEAIRIFFLVLLNAGVIALKTDSRARSLRSR